jgi:predicted nucleic acid-binding protein
MTVTADTSVIVASLASWHEHHDVAFAAVGRVDGIVAHCLLETYSVLTRLPTPHQMSAAVVSKYLDATFGQHPVFGLSPEEQRALVTTCVAQGLRGGQVYDAVIAASCARANAKLLTLDGRARQTYAALSIKHELIA